MMLMQTSQLVLCHHDKLCHVTAFCGMNFSDLTSFKNLSNLTPQVIKGDSAYLLMPVTSTLTD